MPMLLLLQMLLMLLRCQFVPMLLLQMLLMLLRCQFVPMLLLQMLLMLLRCQFVRLQAHGTHTRLCQRLCQRGNLRSKRLRCGA